MTKYYVVPEHEFKQLEKISNNFPVVQKFCNSNFKVIESKKINHFDLMSGGGNWLGSARNYLLCNVRNGDNLTWGSQDIVNITVKQIEELASEVSATTLNNYV